MENARRKNGRQGSVSSMPQTISVIVPVRNAADDIVRCLAAIFAQSRLPDEVLVVDGHSEDGTVDNARKFPVKVLREDYGTRAGACQVGLENCRGDLVAFTDADCQPEPDWLGTLERGFASSEVIGLAGATKAKPSKGLWPESIRLALGTFLGSGESVQWRTYPTRRRTKSPSGCNSIYRKSVLLAAGGFTVGLSGGEDEDLNRRLRRAGDFVYEPGAVVWHNHRMDGLSKLARRMLQYGAWRVESRAWALRAVPPLAAPLLMSTLLVTLWILAPLAAGYVALTAAMGLRFAHRHRRPALALSIPIVYGIGHICYILGFWKQVFAGLPLRAVSQPKPLEGSSG